MTEGKFDIHTEITNRIVAALEKGPGRFELPWTKMVSRQAPKNATTGKTYRGINWLMLTIIAEEQAYPTSQWATFKQWQQAGAKVRKGEKGAPIVFYKQLEITNDKSESVSEIEASDTRKIGFAKASWCFNAAQVEGYEVEQPIELVNPSCFDKLVNVETMIEATRADIRYGGDRAFYRRDEDFIQIPDKSRFVGTATMTGQEAFYSTICHELVHHSGAPHRLNREKGKRFCDRPYCFEELIATLGEAFLCVELGITPTEREDHAQYIGQYVQLMKADRWARRCDSAPCCGHRWRQSRPAGGQCPAGLGVCPSVVADSSTLVRKNVRARIFSSAAASRFGGKLAVSELKNAESESCCWSVLAAR